MERDFSSAADDMERTREDASRRDMIAKGQKLGLSTVEIGNVIDHRTQTSSRRFSDDVSRAAKITFGTDEKADRWLQRPTTALLDLSPIEVAAAGETGVRLVLDLLKRIDHGLAV